MKKHLFKNLLNLDKSSESLWHSSHDPLPPSSPNSMRTVLLCVGVPGPQGSLCPQFSVRGHGISAEGGCCQYCSLPVAEAQF